MYNVDLNIEDIGFLGYQPIFGPRNTKKKLLLFLYKFSYYSIDRKLRKIKQPVVTIVVTMFRTNILCHYNIMIKKTNPIDR